jgi:hypothetical protein
MSDLFKHSNLKGTLFDTPAWVQIEQNLRAEQQALMLKDFYRNLSEYDKRWLAALKIGWSTNA